jgi:hypothetical protein
VIELIPKGRLVGDMLALPLKVQVLWLIVDWTFELPTCVAPAKNAIVPVAGFPQLGALMVVEMKLADPNPLTAATVGVVIVVTAGVIVMTVEAVGPAVKLASPL